MGKNGGDANDAELLALLKGISSGSSKEDKVATMVAEEDAPAVAAVEVTVTDVAPAPTVSSPASPAACDLPPPPPKATVAVAVDDQSSSTAPPIPIPICDSFNPSSKNWKERKQSFEKVSNFHYHERRVA